jgi:hypothetical protein
MTRGLRTALSSLALACALPVLADGDAAAPDELVERGASFEQQVTDYLRRFPYQTTYDYAVRYTGGNPSNLNRWMASDDPALVRAGDDIIPRTNNDTFYKGAALFLRDGPVVLEASAPDMRRFNSFQLIDDRNANYRNIVFPSGKYTLYFGEKPAEIEGEAIEVPSSFSVVIARVEVRNKDDAGDVAGAKAVYQGMKLHGARPAEFPRLDLLGSFPKDVAAEAHRRMDEAFATVPFNRMIVGPGQEPGREVSYLHHSAGTKGGWGAADPAHAAFETLFVDAAGDELNGKVSYTVTTAEPPVDAFWSVTVYDTERGGHLHPNDDDRYHINNTTAVRNPDGTVTFAFRRACRGAALNCLEVPAGRFDVAVRYYLPRTAILAGAWRFPQPEPLDE